MSHFRTSGRPLFDIILGEHRLVENTHKEIVSLLQGDLEKNIQQQGTPFHLDQLILHRCYGLIRDLALHSHKEEILVYPLFERIPSEMSSWDHAIEEHVEVEKCLVDIENMCDVLASRTKQSETIVQTGGKQLLDIVNKLMENVNHHVQDEETRLLPALKGVVGTEEAISLGRQWEGITGSIGSRPHPKAPTKGELAIAANQAIAEEDKRYFEAKLGTSLPSRPGAFSKEAENVPMKHGMMGTEATKQQVDQMKKEENMM